MYVIFDIGGTKVNILTFENEKPESLINTYSIKSADIKNYREGLTLLSNEVKKLSEGKQLDAVGIAMTGDINPKEGVVIDSLFFSDWKNKTVVNDLKEILNVPVYLENDAVCAGIAEVSNILKNKHKNYTFIAMGTGVGGVKLMKYSNSIMIFPWDFGHMIVNKDGAKCLCGQNGCLEVYASGSGIKNQYGKPLEDISDPKVWSDLREYMAQAIISYLAVNPTEKIIFGGGIAHKKAGLVDEIETKVREMVDPSTSVFPEFELARYQQEAQAFGMLQLITPGVQMINMNYY